ncbi:hypothetical protein CDAR_392531 [Caerostris darwini]|uniref:Uncharacterized protein n=1 Tax=Caerostris darwini TaxID=1538125 RepID=A0AAV4NUA1_9ARAC|nr:hypothetical protein CDAR_392531 [Caerostris darwini]
MEILIRFFLKALIIQLRVNSTNITINLIDCVLLLTSKMENVFMHCLDISEFPRFKWKVSNDSNFLLLIASKGISEGQIAAAGDETGFNMTCSKTFNVPPQRVSGPKGTSQMFYQTQPY